MEQIIALYLRLSKAEKRGNTSESIRRQRMLLQQWLEVRELEGQWDSGEASCLSGTGQNPLTVEYVDDGWSGMTENRPGYEKLLAGVITGKVGMVLVKDFSRLSRDHLVLARLREQLFPMYNVRLVAIGDGYDSLYAQEELGDSFRSLFYEYYCHDISKKVKSALQAKKEQGQYATGAVPFGYRNVNGTWEIQPEEADILRFLFGEVASGKTYREAGEAVGMEAARVWYLVHNPVYVGCQVWHRYENHIGREKKTSIIAPENWNSRQGAHEAIVDEKLFRQIAERTRCPRNGTEKGKAVSGKGGGNGRHVFSGITKCGMCGRALVRGRRKRNMLCCRQCTGREEERTSMEALLNICGEKLAGQWEQSGAGEEVGEMLRRYGQYLAGKSERTVSQEQIRMILRQLFVRIEVDEQGNVGLWWNFVPDEKKGFPK